VVNPIVFVQVIAASMIGDSIRRSNVRYTNKKFSLTDEFFNNCSNMILMAFGDD